MDYQKLKIGPGEPKTAIFACVHGDEIMGLKVFQALKSWNFIKPVALLIANPKAVKKKKRFIKKDLNRSFPGSKKGVYEERLAHSLMKEIKKYNLVVDLHATNSNFDSLAIVTKVDQKTKNLLKKIPIKKTALVKKSVFGGHELIAQTKLGLALEYGPDKTGKNYRQALSDLKVLLANAGLIAGRQKIFINKDFYEVISSYKVPKSFIQEKTLKDFQKIKKQQIIGKEKGNIIKSTADFYPIFLGKGRYKETLALMAYKKKIIF